MGVKTHGMTQDTTEQLTLADLERQFDLHRVEDLDFFPECRENLPELTDLEHQRLDRALAQFRYLETMPLLENMTRLVLLSPLLDLAGFYGHPFQSRSEQPIHLALPHQGVLIRGILETFVIQEQLWVLIVESKQLGGSLLPGVHQTLAYLLSAPDRLYPRYALVGNGHDFLFLKVMTGAHPRYAQSPLFKTDRSEGLKQVLQVMKRLALTLRLRGSADEPA